MIDTFKLVEDLKSRINPAYANQIGTESHERAQCVAALEQLQVELMAKQQHLSGAFSQVHEAEKEVEELREQLAQSTARAERAEAELKKEPVATVYIGSGHCKVAFTDAAKEAMKGKQGQSFDVYAELMPRAVKESLTVESTSAQVPQEWREVMTGLVAIAEKKGKKQGSPNHCHARPGIWDDDNGPVLSGKPCAECAMYDKARALLKQAAPSADSGDWTTQTR